MGCLWLLGRLSFRGYAQQQVCVSVKGLGAAGLRVVSLVIAVDMTRVWPGDCVWPV